MEYQLEVVEQNISWTNVDNWHGVTNVFEYFCLRPIGQSGWSYTKSYTVAAERRYKCVHFLLNGLAHTLALGMVNTLWHYLLILV